ncbi:phage tail terminator protein [Rhodobacter capsulatus]|uniref:DUF1834 family protein n=1 Tax=Rhodobacter capsulatus (strain ATCC BAA-309 / NBRC 16581 / SB1003) TaxID=272942 RepID=D5AQT0_RHOCB|nr:hypothetical protein [Rhodobacter capsulatus]YP_004934689.1 portal protein [Rhodobacter phage RcapMu]ADE84736.1 hypothetical protein RCAP_rcc00973 [Rhodobacter capsulatus SB 1003]AER29968.1 hypothetical protein RcapMu46 [Rhodobacter phage RcapMu]MDS0926484.1 hypothetical protein [Rhodobacter capsulatus]
MLADLLSHLTSHLSDPRWAGVDVAENIDALADRAGQVKSGTAIIMPWTETGRPQTLMGGGFRQWVEVQFVVGIVVRLYDGVMGGERAMAFDAYRSDIEAALAGVVIPGFVEPCELVGGETSPISTGVSIYAQTWATARFLTGA